MRIHTQPTLIAAFWALGLSASVAHADIVNADVAKSLEYQQTGPSTVVPYDSVGDGSNKNAFFYGRTFYANPSDFDGGQLTFAGPGSPQNYNISGVLDCCGHYGAGYQTGYLTKSTMDSQFPTGVTYTLTATNSVTMTAQSVNIPYVQDMYAGNVPTFSAATFTALHNASGSGPTTLSFNSFTPDAAATGGQDYLYIYDFTSGMTVANFHNLPASTTSVTLSPGTFTVGDHYFTELIFDNYLNGFDGSVPTTSRSDLRTFFDFTAMGVPEPSAWALMLLGFGGMGLVVRSRPRASAV